jgi:hypothetical protein
MQNITVKKNNKLTLTCSTSEPIGMQTITSVVMDSQGVKHPMTVTNVDDYHFTILLDTTNLAVSTAKFDVKIGDVSSETVQIFIEPNIS